MFRLRRRQELPLMGLFVRFQGTAGYASGFSIFIVLAIISLMLAYILRRTYTVVPKSV